MTNLFYSENVKLELMKKEIEEIRKAIPFFEIAKEVVKVFDGKVYNVKLKRALEEKGLTLYQENREIQYIIKSRSVSDGRYSCVYIHTDYISMTNQYAKGITEKRINADVWCDVIDARKQYYTELANNLEKDLGHVMDTLEDFRKKREELRKLRETLSGSTLCYFDHEFRI